MIPTWGAAFGANAIFNSAEFRADLTHSAMPDKAAPGTTGTFTRATTSTWPNNDGYMVTGVAGEIGFVGARRVRNFFSNTENVPTGTAPTNITVTADALTAPNGTLTADLCTTTATAATQIYAEYLNFPGTSVCASVYVHKGSGATDLNDFALYNVTTASVVQRATLNFDTGVLTPITGSGVTVEALANGWYRLKFVDSTFTIGQRPRLYMAGLGASVAAGKSVYIWGWQLEDVTAQTTQTAGEYVSVGALDYRSELNPLYLDTAGAAAGNASTPDSAATSATGDIALVFDGALTNWAALNTFASITSGGAGQLGWIFEQQAANPPRLRVFLDGTTQTLIPATAAVSFANGVRGKVAVTRASASGDVKFFTSSDNGSTWSQLGTTVSAAAGALFNSTSNLTINNERTFGPVTGKTYGFQMYSGIPPIFGGSGSATPVLDFNPHRDATTPTGTFTSSTTGEVWTINGASSVVRSDYYHGSFVDGVKCFPTDLSGNPIPSTTLLGYQAQGARTNLCLQSNAFTTTWTNSGLTLTQDAIGPDGATSAWTCTDNSAVAIEYAFQNVTLTAATYTFSMFVKKTTGAQASYPMLYANAGGVVAPVTIDTTNGIATAWTAYTASTIASGLVASCVSYNDDFWRVSMSFTGTAAAWTFYLAPAWTTNPTQSTGAADVTAQGSAVFYGAQVELGSFASSYIPTTTIAVARHADVLTYSSAGNISTANGWCYAETTTEWLSSLTNARVVSGRTSGAKLVPMWNTAAFAIYDGTTTATSGAFAGSATPVKAATSWAAGGNMVAYKSGVGGTPVGYTAGTVETSVGIGNNPDGTDSWFGTIRQVRIGQRQLSAGEMQAITAS